MYRYLHTLLILVVSLGRLNVFNTNSTQPGNARVINIGSGLGGPARYIASTVSGEWKGVGGVVCFVVMMVLIVDMKCIV